MKHKWFVLMFCLIATPTFGADAENTLIRTIGAGTASCAAWAKHRINKDQVNEGILKQWVNGFVSGMQPPGLESFLADRLYDERVWDFIDTYCKDNPFDTIAGAAYRLIEKIQDKSIKESSKK